MLPSAAVPSPKSQQGLQVRADSVEDTSMSRCYQCGGYGHSPQSPAPRKTPPPVVSTRALMCKRCGIALDDHEMFGACFPQQRVQETSVLLHQGHLIAV